MATTTKSKAEVITKEESMVLVRNMIRISISSICFFRDIFPKECFADKQYGAVKIHQLQGAHKLDTGALEVVHPEAFLLTQWLEKGVFAALEAEYLQTMVFAIYTKHPISKQDVLIESYEFKISYGGEGKPLSVNDVELHSKSEVKNQAAKFIRALAEFTSSLDDIPDSRWLTIQLKYQENTPSEYEPQFFCPRSSSILKDLNLPVVVNLGSIDTPDYKMNMKFAGLDSLLFEDLCKYEPLPDTSLNDNQSKADKLVKLTEQSQVVERPADKRPVIEEAPKLKDVEPNFVNDFNNLQVFSSDFSAEEKSKVVEFIFKEGKVHFNTCVNKLRLKEEKLKLILEDLTKERYLEKKGRGYVITKRFDDLSSAMTSKATESDRSAVPVAGPEVNSVRFVESSLPAPMKTFGGKNAQPPQEKSTSTHHAPEHVVSPKPNAVIDVHPQKTVMSLSQGSELEQGRSRRRKYSAIKDPIYLESSNVKQKRNA